ncbi:alpha-1,2-mannosidase, putative [Flavobacterium sp. CF108]|uniref:GH92 family glycosyl hydrolase n=1 Tax=unclassified Flavobacterium TaxID=196869 RepID=UPI0008AC8185|nr:MULTISPECIES: GH92 family glycosyl hydrolase [unclassified Flavobacterium]SEO71697.1 alpha-1,2-mannosidase, putative [Flavobacterium sp. fv08]SHH93565.1 alpha-1,2-mannosidase, putative [Flavobacterium sp. CF108]
MKIKSLIFFGLIQYCISVNAQVKEPVEYVNPLMGTQSLHNLSNGNTYPAICRPWGMNFWTPQTGKMGDGWAYTYTAEKIRGFKQTHQPSPWMNDYGQFSIMPVTGKVAFAEDERASWFSHKAEVSKPYYYSVYLADYDVTTEITTTERAAHFQITFPENEKSSIVIDAFDKGSYIKIIPSENKIIGYTTRNSGGVPQNFKNYFVLVFDKPFAANSTWIDKVLTKDKLEAVGLHTGAIVEFKTKKGEKVNVKVASSFISPEQAELTLKNELGAASFDETLAQSKNEWNKVLGKITVEDTNEDQLKTFYSCLYRTVCFPQKQYEINKEGQIVHYSPYNGKVLPGYMYAGTGFWDTFRALYPLLNLVYPSINKEMQEGLINDYKEGGFLPEWSSPGFRNVMVGNNSASVVSDAYMKGLRGYDINTLYEALQHGANNEGPLEAVGRKGVQYYNTLGYVPYDVEINENAARTLEYAYDDFAIWKLAKALDRPKKEINLLEKRMMNYKKLFNPSIGLMSGRNKDGSFPLNFNPFKWGDAFTEGNSWHYSWSVFHDIQGLIDLMGGEKKFTAKLDAVFTTPPVFDDTYYGAVIHEIREMQIMNMGQYAHGNQPIQHMIYLYNYAGEPWKTQYWSREVMNRLYKPTPDGYCGDEDNGQTSAWYIFSAMGFYPVCPATEEYVLGAPLFKKTTLQLENGKQLIINAPNNSDVSKYVNELKWDNSSYTKNYINHFDVLKGGELNFDMTSSPNLKRGTTSEAYPYSYSTSK